jgi:hypothetical protein
MIEAFGFRYWAVHLLRSDRAAALGRRLLVRTDLDLIFASFLKAIAKPGAHAAPTHSDIVRFALPRPE